MGIAHEAGWPDLFVAWTEEDQQASRQEGKIPDLKHWAPRKRVGLDSLMNLAALNAFAADQAAMDWYIQKILKGVLPA